MVPIPGDLVPVDIDPIRPRETKMLRHVFEAVTFERPLRRVVILNEIEGIDDVTPRDFIGCRIDGAFGEGHSAVKRRGHGPIAAYGKRNAVQFAPPHDEGQVEVENVMALDDVGILRVDKLH